MQVNSTSIVRMHVDISAAGLFCDWAWATESVNKEIHHLQHTFKGRKTTACNITQTITGVSFLPNAKPKDLAAKNNIGTFLTPLCAYYSCSVAPLWKFWVGYNSTGERALLHRQQQQLQKEWLMLLSHIQCTDRFSCKTGEEKGSRFVQAQPIMHMCTHARTLSWVLEYSRWMDGALQMGEWH